MRGFAIEQITEKRMVLMRKKSRNMSAVYVREPY